MNEVVVDLIIVTYIFTVFSSFLEFRELAFSYARNYFNVGLILVCLSIILAFLASLRGGGLDYGAYVQIFHDTPSFSEILMGKWESLFDLPVEFGYLLINIISKTIFDDPLPVFIFMSFMSLGLYLYSFKKYSQYPILSFLVYFSLLFFMKETTQIRHGVACALVLYSIQYIERKNFKKYVFIYILELLFHQAAAFSIFLYPISKLKWTFRRTVAVVLLCLIFLQLNWIYDFLNLVSDYGLDYYRIAAYKGNVDAETSISYFKYGAYLILLLICAYYSSKLKRYNKYLNILLSMMVLGVVIQGTLHEFKELADRLSISFYTSAFILIPLTLKLPYNRYIIYFIQLIFCIYFFIRTLAWTTNPLGI